MRKSIKDYNITELSDLEYIIENLPLEIDNMLNIDGKRIHINTYVEERQEEFFNVPDEEFKKLVGKTFVNKDFSIIFKVVGYNPAHPTNFFYEQYERSNKGWALGDWGWLAEAFTYPDWKDYRNPLEVEAMEQYIDCPGVEMNIGREEMYMLGMDGKIYVDTSCGGDYEVYTLLDDNGATFSLIKDSSQSNN